MFWCSKGGFEIYKPWVKMARVRYSKLKCKKMNYLYLNSAAKCFSHLHCVSFLKGIFDTSR